MKKHKITPRRNWTERVESQGFKFHTIDDNTYWDETVCYSFTSEEIDNIEIATNTLNSMCLKAAEHIIQNNRFKELHIPSSFIPLIKQSWELEFYSFYGRFDLAYDGKNIKMLEYNADTPTSLLEASVIQWDWLNDYNQSQETKHDQFNSIHEGLMCYFSSIKKEIDCMHLTCSPNSLEDFITTKYIEDVCSQSNIKTAFLYINEIGWDSKKNCFVDTSNQQIHYIFKLYPWEWLCHEEFWHYLSNMSDRSYWIEPAWKMLLSNKGILPILWELYPDHELLLPSYFDKSKLNSTNYVKKPLLSREGSNIQIVQDNQIIAENEGDYGEEGYIYQEYFEIPRFNDSVPIIGSWVIDQIARGIGIREDISLITGNTSRFVPHFFSGVPNSKFIDKL